MSGQPLKTEVPGQGDAAWLGALITSLLQNWKALLAGPVLVGLVAYGITYLIPPTFTSRTTLLLPQQQQSATAAAVASLSALSGLAGASTRTPGDQYVALMRSATVSDRLIDEFNLMSVYESKRRADARFELANNVRIEVGKKDGLVTIEVDDRSPERAATIANQYVDELRRMTSYLALTEAQQRRQFFESQLDQTRKKLTQAQIELQASGFSAGALRAEPRAAADGYARIKAQITAAEVRLQTLQRALTDNAPEVQLQLTTLSALRGELAQIESTDSTAASSEYLTRYRDFKYQETLFDLFARQYELARVDESREGVLIQVIDPAQPPEVKSKPKRVVIAAASAALGLCLLAAYFVLSQSWQRRT
jgi:uncharacterized protein involved in exopolysaccharide biosynthesis